MTAGVKGDNGDEGDDVAKGKFRILVCQQK